VLNGIRLVLLAIVLFAMACGSGTPVKVYHPQQVAPPLHSPTSSPRTG
jgi:hypothetical protein